MSRRPLGVASRGASGPPRNSAPQWHIIPIPTTGQLLRLGAAASEQQLVEVDDAQAILAEFCMIQRKAGPELVMLTARPSVLVNGLPALSLTVLRPRDTLGLLPGQPQFVTQRIRPYVGSPPKELLGTALPKVQDPAVRRHAHCARHRCGVAYHYETEESHPHVAESDRLDCFLRVRACLSCQRPLTLDETLVWDPATAT